MKRLLRIVASALGLSATACDDTDCRNDLSWSNTFEGQLVYVESASHAGLYGRPTDPARGEYIEDMGEGPWVGDIPSEERRVLRLEATLTIPEPEDLSPEVIVHGKGTLHYRETVIETCIGTFASIERPLDMRGVA